MGTLYLAKIYNENPKTKNLGLEKNGGPQT